MGLLFAISLPGLMCLLVALGALDSLGRWMGRRSWLPWQRGRAGRQVSATIFDEMAACLSAGKRLELDQRNTTLMLRDDEESGAPPRDRIRLGTGAGAVTVVLPPHR